MRSTRDSHTDRQTARHGRPRATQDRQPERQPGDLMQQAGSTSRQTDKSRTQPSVPALSTSPTPPNFRRDKEHCARCHGSYSLRKQKTKRGQQQDQTGGQPTVGHWPIDGGTDEVGRRRRADGQTGGQATGQGRGTDQATRTGQDRTDTG